MDAIHNAVDKAKELFTPGESHAADADITKAAEQEEDMQHQKVVEEIAADKKIAKAAEKVEKRRHELSLQKIREASNYSAAGNCLEEQRKQQVVDVEDCLEDQRKQQVVDVAESERCNDTYFTTGQQQPVVVGDPALGVQPVHADTITVSSGINTVPAAEQVEQFNARYDMSEKLDKEAHKQKMKTLEAEEKLAKAVEELDRTMIKKAEKCAAADARIYEAADRVASLQEQEQPQRCHQAVIENNTAGTGASNFAPVEKVVYTRTEIH